ncbi:DUF4856 domain-containing protein [Salinimicrobium oceani]|uniref:DUF4856 domain-containing protein n=1 Tax=Salinimicrobium oceani TaxID=2722702 RepID=A0ABX1D2V5_9FLAO|nr:DUF4856 domain-containing protein [Salinimicrobium oceani]NJW53999.1 DUF4856 domain-containing protein [Salinimicrobium oceani]
MKKALFAALVGGIAFTSCSTDDDSVIPTNKVDVPETYSFTRDEQSTVSFDGQTTRLLMAGDLTAGFMTPEATEEELSNMFSNENNPFSDEALNTSSKSVKSKVAASTLYFGSNTVESNAIKDTFESWITEQATEVFPNWEVLAEAGVAGQIAQGDKTRYVNAKGIELNQLFAKSLIGALLTDQILNNYLSQSVLDEGDNVENNNNAVTEEGKSYTTMEHKWDEAYGYLVGHPSVSGADPMISLSSNEDRLLFNYLQSVNSDSDFAGIAEETFEAFKVGRAAIVAGDYELRDEQVAIIRENLSLVSAVRAIHYLQGGKVAIQNEDMGAAFHELSEGLGFLYSLRFTHNPATGEPYLAPEVIFGFQEQLMAGNGFWDVTPETLDSISEAIATAFGITVAQAAE